MTSENDDTQLSNEKSGAGRPPAWRFPKTRWSLVLAAGKPDGNASRNEFFGMYWSSVVAFLCRIGCSRQEAEDRTQGFFTRLLERNDLARVEYREGRRFRSWLCTCVKRYFLNQLTHERTARNWTGQAPAEFDNEAFRPGPDAAGTLDTEATIDRIWDQCWAHEVMQRALAALREHRHCRGRRMALYEEICNPAARQALTKAERVQNDTLLAKQLGVKGTSIRVYRMHARQAFLDCLNAEIELTLDVSSSLREERTRLLQAFSATDAVLANHSDIGPPALLN